MPAGGRENNARRSAQQQPQQQARAVGDSVMQPQTNIVTSWGQSTATPGTVSPTIPPHAKPSLQGFTTGAGPAAQKRALSAQHSSRTSAAAAGMRSSPHGVGAAPSVGLAKGGQVSMSARESDNPSFLPLSAKVQKRKPPQKSGVQLLSHDGSAFVTEGAQRKGVASAEATACSYMVNRASVIGSEHAQIRRGAPAPSPASWPAPSAVQLRKVRASQLAGVTSKLVPCCSVPCPVVLCCSVPTLLRASIRAFATMLPISAVAETTWRGGVGKGCTSTYNAHQNMTAHHTNRH